MKEEKERLNEYRIKYNDGAEYSAEDSYHYYSAFSSREALNFHNAMMARKNKECQVLSVEKKCPWQGVWKDESKILNSES